MNAVARPNKAATFSVLFLVLLAAMLVSLNLGSAKMSWSQVIATLLGHGYRDNNLVIFDLRMPRIVMSVLVGAGLAVSGVILQGVTRNDLASPGTVGISGGSGLGMTFLLVAYPTLVAKWPLLLSLGAVVGAVLTTGLVFVLSYRHGVILPSRLLLVGIAIEFAAQAAMLLLSLRMSFITYNYVASWLSGTLAASDWKSIRLLLPFCIVLVPAAWTRARTLDTFSLGDQMAGSLGVSVERERLLLLAIATVLTSACVALGGHIAFLGLVAPHVARRLVGSHHAILFPASALCGAILLLVADSLGRHLFAPQEIPAGVLVGILGGIYFVYLLTRSGN
ncbi:MAG TPA: iron ABC transporter permease [Lacipirellulaceae bacterium]|nr:iron ABC transporter permease [Lacipirellulaceae bacterium]